MMDPFELRGLLRLSAIHGMGPLRIRALLSHFGSAHNALKASARDLCRVQGIDRTCALAIKHHEVTDAFIDGQLRAIERVGGEIVTCWSDRYPDLLKRIYDPPLFLFVRGLLHVHPEPLVAVVGTRRPSPYGEHITRLIVRGLTAAGFGIVSGLARGIDTIAHSEAVACDGRTVGVLGSGLDVPYPRENAALMERITEEGAVLSECLMGAKPDPQNFPRRNRIVSGMSHGTVVVESDIDGGAMITASTALDQNREVFAVPGSIVEPMSAGPHHLIKEGRAKLAGSVDDILAELPQVLGGPSKTAIEAKPLALSLFEQRIFDLLTTDPIHIDTITRKTELGAADVLVALLGLEFKKLVRQIPGKYFVKH